MTNTPNSVAEGQQAIAAAIHSLGTAFEEFKRTNDERLSQLEGHGKSSDPITEDKLARINDSLDEFDALKRNVETFMARPEFGGGSDPNGSPAEEQFSEVRGRRYETNSDDHQKAVFTAWMMTGRQEYADELTTFATGDQTTVADNAEAGFAVPTILDRTLTELVREHSVMRNIARHVPVGSPDYKRLVNLQGATAGWVGETDARPNTKSPLMAEISPVWGEIYAFPKASQQALEDPFFDVENWIETEVAYAMVEAEDLSFVVGNGVKQPRGLMDYYVDGAGGAQGDAANSYANATLNPWAAPNAESLKTDAQNRQFGVIQAVKTGVNGGFAATGAADVFFNVEAELHPRFRGNAQWAMNRRTLSEVRKIKLTDNQYLWVPGLANGKSSTIIGYGYTEDEYMPVFTDANAPAIAFGSMSDAYWIMERPGTDVTLRDPYTQKPFLAFYVRRRVGAMLNQSQAVKMVAFGA